MYRYQQIVDAKYIHVRELLKVWIIFNSIICKKMLKLMLLLDTEFLLLDHCLVHLSIEYSTVTRF